MMIFNARNSSPVKFSNTMNQCLIYYPSGHYGAFVEWLCYFYEDPAMSMPFNSNGDSHRFVGNFLLPKEKIFEYIASDQKTRFSRAHPAQLFEKVNQHEYVFEHPYHTVLNNELCFLKTHFNKILVIVSDKRTTLWEENNWLTKTIITNEVYQEKFQPYGYAKEHFQGQMTFDPVKRIQHCIDQQVKSAKSTLTVKNLQGWGKDNIMDFDVWQLRELLCFFWFERTFSMQHAYTVLQQLNPDLLFVSLSDLRDNFVDTVQDIAAYFELKPTAHNIHTSLGQVYDHWAVLQKQMYKDRVCCQIVDALCNNKDMDWSNQQLSIIDEAWVQKQLFDQGIHIKCDGLDVFPTNCKDFKQLLDFVN